jgi:2-methylisocitrate lyase-like PEP mutase family enzyme
MSYGNALRAGIERDEILQLPGAYDGYGARIFERAGFEGIYMTGYGTSVSKTGYPDAGLITMPEMIENANNLQEAVDVPLLADCDNGFGNATNVIRTVREYIKTGVGGIHIEDQTFPKRCGHVKGKQLIPKEEAVGKYRAAADVRDERDEDFVIVARRDARGAVGGSLEEASDRANGYCEAGADVAFVEGPVDEGEMERICEEVEAPLLYNWAGISPNTGPERLEEIGYDVVIYPGAEAGVVTPHLVKNAARIKDDPVGTFEELSGMSEELGVGGHELAGFPEVVGWEEEYLPEEDREKYEDTLGADIHEDD